MMTVMVMVVVVTVTTVTTEKRPRLRLVKEEEDWLAVVGWKLELLLSLAIAPAVGGHGPSHFLYHLLYHFLYLLHLHFCCRPHL